MTTPPSDSRVAVVGGTGMLGREIVRQLTGSGHRVVVATRDPARASSLAAGVEVRRADLAETPSLAMACQGIDVVIASAHAMLGRGRYRSEQVDDRGHRALIEAAKDAGVRHFVYISVLGASPSHPVDFWRTKFRVEEHLKASGLSWTILRPAAFMEMHGYELIGKSILAGRTATILGRGDRPMNFVAVRDVARVTVLAVAEAALRGQIIAIGGPDNLSQNEIASMYGRLCGRAPKLRHVPPSVVGLLSVLLGPLHPGIARVMRASVAGARLDQTFDASALLSACPMTLTRFEDVVKEQVLAASAQSR